jgi:nucleotide-binding universal stress UspA family protein
MSTISFQSRPTKSNSRRVTISVPRPEREPSATPSLAAPIVVAVDGSTASTRAATEAIRLGKDMRAPLLFVYVRRGPSLIWGQPFYQRQLTQAMAAGRKALSRVGKMAAGANVEADQVILEGAPARRLVEFARSRGAQLIVTGTRRRKVGRSVSQRVVAASSVPVLVRA